ncbi:MAG TPA: trehalose-phosphatase [Telluria sp.]|nr:trehalose-phosphatase [Telluria sp.]
MRIYQEPCPMTNPPDDAHWELLIAPGDALFLDFDGTLVELAATPDSVAVAPDLVAALGELHARLGGRLAIISGRPLAQIDALLAPLVLPVAGVHGMQRRGADGVLHCAPLPDLAAARDWAVALAARHPGLWVEEKYGALALHYRQAPALGPLCREVLAAMVCRTPELLLMEGKMIIEVKAAGIDKGTAIGDFMAEAPFAGHRAVFVGDDTTDEAGFALVQERDGIAIKVGAGASVARHRIGSPPELRGALLQLLDHLRLRS